MQDSTHIPQPPTDDEIDLLDLLVTMSEHIKLLILGPLLAGLIALGVGFALPETYQSTSLLVVEKPNRPLNVNTVSTLATSACHSLADLLRFGRFIRNDSPCSW